VVLLVLSAASDFFGWIYSIWAVATIVSLPVTVRRLRDAGKPWAWIFIGLIPLIWLTRSPGRAPSDPPGWRYRRSPPGPKPGSAGSVA
jgi:uncharacterized membrane protein YhaH (DUF805 family)